MLSMFCGGFRCGYFASLDSMARELNVDEGAMVRTFGDIFQLSNNVCMGGPVRYVVLRGTRRKAGIIRCSQLDDIIFLDADVDKKPLDVFRILNRTMEMGKLGRFAAPVAVSFAVRRQTASLLSKTLQDRYLALKKS
jgi:hypothetical protein